MGKMFEPSSKSKKLYKLMDELDDCKEEMLYHAINSKSNRLNYIEKNAVEIERISKEMQELIKTMRRK